jgi:Na+/H+ antiporter NhaD/arsenite permease-like protein
VSTRSALWLLAAGAGGALAAWLGSSAHAEAAASQAWPAFALVAGLLLVGAAAAKEGVFAAAGAAAARALGGPAVLLTLLLLLEAVVTAVLGLALVPLSVGLALLTPVRF